MSSALSLYWLVGGLVAFIQQSIILREDKEELTAVTKDTKKKSAKTAVEAEIVSEPTPATKAKKKGASQNRKKRRK
jgi:membrane protein insertase Oxa1/YidC/SpoIIIJ